MTAEVLQFPQPALDAPGGEAVGDQFVSFSELARLIPGEVTLAQLAPEQPETILLGSLRDGRFRVLSPISVAVQREDDHLVVEATELNEFGFGKNLSEAVADLQNAICELYFNLAADQDRLGPDLLPVWNNLRQKVAVRPS